MCIGDMNNIIVTDGVFDVLKSTGEYNKYSMYIVDIMQSAIKVEDTYFLHAIQGVDEAGFTNRFLHKLENLRAQRVKDDPNSPYNGICYFYDRTKNESEYLSLILNKIHSEEIREKIRECNKKILSGHNAINKTIRPDFILHEPDTLNRQEYYGEIKMRGNKKALDDLIKISKWKEILEEAYSSDEYLENGLDPRYGLYIYMYVDIKTDETGISKTLDSPLGCRISRLKSCEKKKNIESCDRDIICITLIVGEDRRVECQTLGEIIDEIENKQLTNKTKQKKYLTNNN